MKDFRNFWKSVRNDIDNQHFINATKSWNEMDINLFREDMFEVIAEYCKVDSNKSKLMNYQPQFDCADDLQIIRDKAFRSIFREYDSSGKAFTRNLFAIYLGYDSYLDYIRTKDIKENNFEASEPLSHDHSIYQEQTAGDNQFVIYYVPSPFPVFKIRKYQAAELQLTQHNTLLQLDKAENFVIDKIEEVERYRMPGDFAKNWIRLHYYKGKKLEVCFISSAKWLGGGAFWGSSRNLYGELLKFMNENS